MAMPGGGGYGGYGGGPDDYYHQDGNGNLNHASGGGGGSGSGMEQDTPEYRLLKDRILELEAVCKAHEKAASETQALLEERAIARLVTEREVKEMQQQHQEKEEIYREKAREINEKCVMGDNRIKELQEKQKKHEGEMRDAMKKRREMVISVKEQEREAILNEERRRRASSAGSGSNGISNGGAASPAAAAAAAEAAAASYNGKIANGARSGRRSQPSTGGHVAPRRASTGTGAGAGAGAAEGDRRPQGQAKRFSAQPKPFEQMRQTFVEDTLTDFFGL